MILAARFLVVAWAALGVFFLWDASQADGTTGYVLAAACGLLSCVNVILVRRWGTMR